MSRCGKCNEMSRKDKVQRENVGKMLRLQNIMLRYFVDTLILIGCCESKADSAKYVKISE